MRKKSHVSLAKYLVREMESEALTRHKKAFYLGSVLPDLNPKMFQEPHKFDTSYDKFRREILRTVAYGISDDCKERILWRRIGVILHYLADYFTFPHNATYEGGLKGHCMYERNLKYEMRRFVRAPESFFMFCRARRDGRNIPDAARLLQYIESAHQEYMGEEHTADNDCRWIAWLCCAALTAITDMIRRRKEAAAEQPLFSCQSYILVV